MAAAGVGIGLLSLTSFLNMTWDKILWYHGVLYLRAACNLEEYLPEVLRRSYPLSYSPAYPLNTCTFSSVVCPEYALPSTASVSEHQCKQALSCKCMSSWKASRVSTAEGHQRQLLFIQNHLNYVLLITGCFSHTGTCFSHSNNYCSIYYFYTRQILQVPTLMWLCQNIHVSNPRKALDYNVLNLK